MTYCKYLGIAKGVVPDAVAGDANDGNEADAPLAPVKKKAVTPAKPAPSAGPAAVAIGDSSKEVGAGQLKASADTETGTKQRKVNKRLNEYASGSATEPKKDA